MLGPHPGQALPCCAEAGVGEKVAQHAHAWLPPGTPPWALGTRVLSLVTWHRRGQRPSQGALAVQITPTAQVWATSHPPLPGTLHDHSVSERLQNRVSSPGCGLRLPGPPPRAWPALGRAHRRHHTVLG